MDYLTTWNTQKLVKEIALEEELKDLRTKFEGDVRLKIERLFDEGNETGQQIKTLAEGYGYSWGCNAHAINLIIYNAIGFARIKSKYTRTIGERVKTKIKSFLKSKISLSVCDDVNYLVSANVLEATTDSLTDKVTAELWEKWGINSMVNDIAYSYARTQIKKSIK